MELSIEVWCHVLSFLEPGFLFYLRLVNRIFNQSARYLIYKMMGINMPEQTFPTFEQCKFNRRIKSSLSTFNTKPLEERKLRFAIFITRSKSPLSSNPLFDRYSRELPRDEKDMVDFMLSRGTPHLLREMYRACTEDKERCQTDRQFFLFRDPIKNTSPGRAMEPWTTWI